VSRYEKGKTNLDLLEQEILSGNGISWAIYKSAPCPREITMPVSHHSVFLQDGCPSCYQTNSIKALMISACKIAHSVAVMMLTTFRVQSGFTPLHIAAHYGSLDVATLLLDNGADIDFSARVCIADCMKVITTVAVIVIMICYVGQMCECAHIIQWLYCTTC